VTRSSGGVGGALSDGRPYPYRAFSTTNFGIHCFLRTNLDTAKPYDQETMFYQVS
jgi:hypothetical protein